MKAKQVKAERTIITRKYTCRVCGKKDVLHPYGLLRDGECVCSLPCNQKYLRGGRSA